MPKFKNARGYRAELIHRDAERVIYRCWDDEGLEIQRHGSRAPADFDRDWTAV